MIKCIYTARYMFVYETVNHALHVRTQTLRRECSSQLYQFMYIINEKLKYFVTLLAKNCIIDVML